MLGHVKKKKKKKKKKHSFSGPCAAAVATALFPSFSPL
jgi:hypothetical protein